MSYNEYTLGIDLGTTFSCAYIFKDGEFLPVPNSYGDRVMPSIVSFLDNINKEILVGEQAYNESLSNLKNTIYGIKRIIGKEYSDKKLQEDIKNFPFEVVKDEFGDRPRIKIKRESGEVDYYSPEEISSFVLKKIKDDAEKFCGQSVKNVVITVPAYFNDTQRTSTQQAGRLAGFQVLRIINEPTAAALAYGTNYQLISNNNKARMYSEFLNLNYGSVNKPEVIMGGNEIVNNKEFDKKILVFDLGGGTLDVSLVNITKPKGSEVTTFKVLGTSGDSHLGGEDFDNLLVEYAIKAFCDINNFPIKIKEEIKKNKTSIKRLKLVSEKVKRDLSFLEPDRELTLQLDNFYKNKELNVKISRKSYENECKILNSKMFKPIQELLKDCKIDKIKEINEIVLVGGSSRIPCVSRFLKAYFKEIKINNSINPDEVVALGAAIHARNLYTKNNKIILLDVTPLSLGVAVENPKIKEGDKEDVLSVIVRNNSRIPLVSEKHKYHATYDYMDFVLLRVYEGNNYYIKDNHKLGFYKFPIPSRKIGEVELSIYFEIDENGILTIHGIVEKEETFKTEVKPNMSCLSQDELNEIGDRTFNIINEDIDETNLDDYKESFDEFLKAGNNIKKKYESLMSSQDFLFNIINEYEKKFFKDSDNNVISEMYFKKVEELVSCLVILIDLVENSGLYLDIRQKGDIISRSTKLVKDFIDKLSKNSQIFVEKIISKFSLIPSSKLEELVLYGMQIYFDKGSKHYAEILKQVSFSKYNSKISFEEVLKIEEILLNKKGKYVSNPNDSKKIKDLSKESRSKLIEFNQICLQAIRKIIDNKNKILQIQSNLCGITNDMRDFVLEDFNTSHEKLVSLLDHCYETLNYVQMTEENIQDKNLIKGYLLAQIVRISYDRLGGTNYENYFELAKKALFYFKNTPEVNQTMWYKNLKESYEFLKNQIEALKKDNEICKNNNIKNYAKKEISMINEKFDSSSEIDFIKFVLEFFPYDGYELEKQQINLNNLVFNRETVSYYREKYYKENNNLNGNKEEIKKNVIFNEIYEKLDFLYSVHFCKITQVK